MTANSGMTAGTTSQTTSGAGLTASASTSGSQSTGAVLGVTSSAPAHGRSGGVLGATAAVSTGTLPFTGVQIWIAALAALIILGAGVALRRLARPTASVV
jgi:hypothetical protein